MAQWTLVGLIVGAAAALAGLAAVLWFAWRRGSQAPDGWAGPGPEAHRPGSATEAGKPGPGAEGGRAIARRELLDRGVVALFAGALAGVAASGLTFLWPSITGQTGRRYTLGSAGRLQDRLSSGRPFYHAQGRFYLVAYAEHDLERARAAYPKALVAGMEAGSRPSPPVAPTWAATCRSATARRGSSAPVTAHGSTEWASSAGDLRRGGSTTTR